MATEVRSDAIGKRSDRLGDTIQNRGVDRHVAGTKVVVESEVVGVAGLHTIICNRMTSAIIYQVVFTDLQSMRLNLCVSYGNVIMV